LLVRRPAMQVNAKPAAAPGDGTPGSEEPALIKMNNQHSKLDLAMPEASMSVAKHNEPSKSVSQELDVEAAVLTGGNVAAARKSSFTGMPYDDEFCLSKDQAVKLLSHGGLNPVDTEAALQEMDTNGDGMFEASEVGSQIGRLLKKAHAQVTVIKRLNKAVIFLGALLALSVCVNFGMSFVAVELSKELKVEDGSLKTKGGNTVATHNRKNVYPVSNDFKKNETESRRRLEAGDKVQVAAVTCAAVREGIGSLEVGENEGAVKIAVQGGYFFTASVTASFYHAGANFGIEGIHLNGNIDAVYGVECEEAKCSDTAYQCPVLGLALTDEGRRRLDCCHGLGDSSEHEHESGGTPCHPAGSYFTLEDGKSIAIERAAVGTLVKTDTGFRPIIGFLHEEADIVGSYLHFTTPSASMTISPLHHAFVNGAEIDPSFIKLGDLLHTPHGLEPVTRIETLEARGAYHPFVKGGNYYVDGILASDYYGLVPKAVWSLGRAYVEARYWLGIPVIPVGKGFFPDHAWAAGSLGRAGVPVWAQKTVLSPLTVASSILTELANIAVERFPAWLGTAVAATAAIKAGRTSRL